MKPALFFAAIFALAACASQTSDNGGYLNNTNPITPTGGLGGVGASGQGGAGMPVAGVGAQGAAGMTPMTGGFGGQQGTAGFAPAAGTGGMFGTAGTMSATSGAGGQGAGGTSGAGGQPAAGGTTGGNTAGTVTIQLTTVTYGGEYAPLNYGAVWFETASGEFIKTAKRWAGTVHESDLVAWTEASGGWSIFGGNAADMMDAIGSATIRTHQMHMITWDMMNIEGELVPDGNYVAVLEMSESRARDRDGPTIRIEFTKGPSPQMVSPPAQEGFTGVSLSYTP